MSRQPCKKASEAVLFLIGVGASTRLVTGIDRARETIEFTYMTYEGIETVEDLRMATDKRLLGIVNFGEKSLRELRSLVNPDLEYDPKKESSIAVLKAENERLRALINNPQADDFIEAIKTEAAHQCERWDDSKNTNADWMWRLAYISTKTVHKDDKSKVKHWIVSCGALCLNWFKSVKED